MDRSALRRYYDHHATVYDRWMVSYDRVMLGDLRRRLCALARGRTLELAVGTGLNISGYPSGTPLVGLDYSRRMLEVARRRVEGIEVAMALIEGDAAALPFPDATFDTVVTTLFLSTAPDPAASVAEMSRVLRPGGSLLVFDHGRSHLVGVRFLERVVGRLLRGRTGLDLNRAPIQYLDRCQLRIDQVEWSRLGIIHTMVCQKAQ